MGGVLGGDLGAVDLDGARQLYAAPDKPRPPRKGPDSPRQPQTAPNSPRQPETAQTAWRTNGDFPLTYEVTYEVTWEVT